ncbi:hypothetical protein [Streptomyces sp. NPDC016845]|uniref:hypothetical protein n=1 Tax=Streptomyces sp. NPDC016845 TaxID=3364972 RepID=UPI0037B12946
MTGPAGRAVDFTAVGADPRRGIVATPLTLAIESEGDATPQSGGPLNVSTTAVLLRPRG